MSTRTTETVGTAHAGQPDSPVPTSPPALTPTRGLIRATLRVHRSALWFWGLLMVLVGGGLLWAAGPGVDAAWAEHVRRGCAPADYCAQGPAYSMYDLVTGLGRTILTVTPVLIGAWAGGALIARELESGTAHLAWTQSVTPTRWLAAKLAVPAALIVSGTVLLTLLNRLVWWREEPLRQARATEDWFASTVFVGHGTLATAYALLGLAVGVLAGLLLRRSLPALGAGLVGTGLLAGVLQSNRHRLWPAETLVSKSSSMHDRSGELVDRGFISGTGERVSDLSCTGDSCDRTDAVAFYADFHPSSHFWPLQLVETGIVLTATALLVRAAFRLLSRSTGEAV
ncbi:MULTISPECIES: ABC transporter [Streptomyces]|uniref:ABC transporter n=1 Tax=Streptomyces bottropensis ATCC 25435 TaxID=1054862 RepID=M3DIP0_9ACTN|nr:MULTISPECIES: ABC transporter [Streptomyces]EMF56667.1 ABC transporter [Streptomyces bottropensis ATCC 25435]MZD17094.1 ABC transporter permease [Streptomyces sp. SID5476]